MNKQKKILVQGSFDISSEQWTPLKILLGLDPTSRTKIGVVNKSLSEVLTEKDLEQFDLILTVQNNPIMLKRLIESVKSDTVVIKPFRNRKKQITHFMKIKEVIVKYESELIKVPAPKKKSA